MRKTMQWQLQLFIVLEFIILSNQSIVGVTYQNHFNFEERYSNVRECDPFYWHPLHLPDHCMKMYDKLIRSRVSAAVRSPVRVVRRRPDPYTEFNDYEPEYYDHPTFYNEYGRPSFYIPEESETEEDNESMSPYEEMYNYLKRDVKKNPTAPVVGMVPNYGPIAVYKQPISKKSKHLITKIASAYADAGKVKTDDETYYGNIDIKYPGFEFDDKGKNQKKKDINHQGLDIDIMDKNQKKIDMNNPSVSQNDDVLDINQVVQNLRRRLKKHPQE